MLNFSEESKLFIVRFMNLIDTCGLMKLKESQELMIDSAFTIIQINSSHWSKHENEANLLFKMTVLKSLSLLPFLENRTYSNAINTSKFQVPLDPFSRSTIVRSQLEVNVNFYNIFLQSKNEEELKLKYSLWFFNGLNNRQSYRINKYSKYADYFRRSFQDFYIYKLFYCIL